METLPREVRTVSQYDLEPFKRGRKVGYYLLGKVVGEGSFAKVREGVHILTGEKVAVKIIDKKRAREDRYISKNLRREAKILQLIRHAHIIQLLEVLETDNFYYLVMEFCAGGELLDYICARKRLDEKSARRLISQLVSAVDVMHRKGVVHRDLKIENFLLNQDDDLKIIDFGLSNTIPAACLETFEKTGIFSQLLNTHCGSPAYAAPELLAQKNYGPQVDIWSIGINMYAMLTGFLPYMMEPFNVMEMYEKMMQRKMTPIPSFLSKECRDLLMRLLEPVPEWRITLKQVMKHRWFENCEPSPHTLSLGDIMYEKKELCESVLSYMKHSLKIKTKDTVNAVTSNRALHASAVYHLLVKRLDRYLRDSNWKLEIIKKATLPSPKRITGIIDSLHSTSNGKTKRFTFRGRKINSSSKSQPILVPDGEVPKTKTKIVNETRSSPDSIAIPVKSAKYKCGKKEKVTRTHSDKTHARNKTPMEYKVLTPSTLSKTLDSTPENVERRIRQQYRRLKRSASSDNEEDIRNSIRNSLSCDSDQDFFKPILPSSTARTGSHSPHDPFPRNDDTVVAARKLSFEDVTISSTEKKSLSDDSTEVKSMAKKEVEKSDSLAIRRNSLLETDSIENNIKETKEPCPGWMITKIVKQPPLKPEQPPLKPESFLDVDTNLLFDKLQEADLLNVNGDSNYNGSTNNENTNHNGDKGYLSKSTRSESKSCETSNLNIEKKNKTEDIPIKLPIHRKISETKFQNAFSKTIKQPTRKEIIDNYIPIRRANTSDSIKSLAAPPLSFAPPTRRQSSGNLNTKKFQDLESLTALIEMKTKAYNKIMTPLKQKNLSDASNTGALDNSIISSGETTPELEQILSNIEYINRHHLNINSSDRTGANERVGTNDTTARRDISSSIDRTGNNNWSGMNDWTGMQNNTSANDMTDANHRTDANDRTGTNDRTANKIWTNTTDKTGIPTSEEYRKTVKNISNSYNHEGIWKPPDRVNVSEVSNNVATNHPKVIWRSDTKDKTNTNEPTSARKYLERQIPNVLINSHNFDCDMDYKVNKSQKHIRPASTPPETFLLNTEFNSDENNNDVKSEITPKVIKRHRIAKLESFKKDYGFLQSPRMENKISSSINKITPSKKVVELNVALFKNIQSTSPQYDQRTRSIDELNIVTPHKLSPSLKPLEISFDFVQMKKRASMLKNQAKSMPNVNDLDDDCLTTNNLENTPLAHEYNSHIYNSAGGVEIDTTNLSKIVYGTQGDMGLMSSQKYYSSLSLTTPESIV